MKGKRILLVSNGFYPEISPRSYRVTELAKEFLRQEHDVTVISKYREHNYSDFLEKYPINLKMWNKSSFPEIPVGKGKLGSLLGRIVSRILLILFEYPGIEEMFMVKKKLSTEKGYDLMISFAVPYPVQWGVAWSHSLRHPIASCWVADCGDPYMGDVLDSFKKAFYFKYLEKWFCRKAVFITIPIEGAKSGYYSEFHDKIRIIPQGFSFELNKNGYRPSRNNIPTFAYAGGFLAGARDPKALMLYLLTLDFPFRFLVFTNMPDLFDEYRSKLGDKLVVSGYIPREELIEVLIAMDFLLNFDNNTTRNSPSKLIDYAITTRPVLNIYKRFEGEELLAFLKGDYSNRMILPDPEQFHISNISKQFEDLIVSKNEYD